MRDPFANYDAWLERPYQDMMEESDRFVDWAEENDYDLDDLDAMKIAEENYEFWIQDQAESQAEAQYEAYLDRMEYEAQEEDEYFDRW